MGNDAIVKDDVPGTPGSVTEANTESSNVWQAPLTLCFSWWSASIAFWLPTVVQSNVPHHEPHEQLILPEAVAAGSVPSLFA